MFSLPVLDVIQEGHLSVSLVMADFIRGAFGVSRSSSERRPSEKLAEPILPPRPDKERLHASPSTGSDNIDDCLEEFDPFGTSQAENDDVDGPNSINLVAPPEKE